jgi:hypothetical protein
MKNARKDHGLLTRINVACDGNHSIARGGFGAFLS